MRQTDIYRSGKPPVLPSRNCFELLVKSITSFVTPLAPDSWAGFNERDGAHNHCRESGVQCSWVMGPDQHVLDHRQQGLIAPLVTMSRRPLLRRVASGGV